MKPEIHPNYQDVKITCSCGSSFVTRSTLADKNLHVEVCSKCHPFFTGKQKLVDTAGRVERFRNRFKGASSTNTGKTDSTGDKGSADTQS